MVVLVAFAGAAVEASAPAAIALIESAPARIESDPVRIAMLIFLIGLIASFLVCYESTA